MKLLIHSIIRFLYEVIGTKTFLFCCGIAIYFVFRASWPSIEKVVEWFWNR